MVEGSSVRSTVPGRMVAMTFAFLIPEDDDYPEGRNDCVYFYKPGTDVHQFLTVIQGVYYWVIP